MSRIGKKPIPVLDGVKVSVSGRTVNIEGPAGKISWTYRPEISVALDSGGKNVVVDRSGDDRLNKSLHGLTRSVISNMILGCKNGYLKAMEVYGVGYGVQLQGNKFTLNCGKSHPVVFEVPAGIKIEVTVAQARGDTEPAKFVIKGADKHLVGEFAAQVRKIRKPEPYKGKGVRYAGEYVRRKVGKAFAGAGAGA